MRIFEKLVLKQELSLVMESVIGKDQYAYKEKHNTSTMALIKCYHSWVKWLDEEVVSLLTVFLMMWYAIS